MGWAGLGGADTKLGLSPESGAPLAGLGGADTQGSGAAHPGLGWGEPTPRALRCGTSLAGLRCADTHGSHVRHTLGWAGLGGADTKGSQVQRTLGWAGWSRHPGL